MVKKTSYYAIPGTYTAKIVLALREVGWDVGKGRYVLHGDNTRVEVLCGETLEQYPVALKVIHFKDKIEGDLVKLLEDFQAEPADKNRIPRDALELKDRN